MQHRTLHQNVTFPFRTNYSCVHQVHYARAEVVYVDSSAPVSFAIVPT